MVHFCKPSREHNVSIERVVYRFNHKQAMSDILYYYTVTRITNEIDNRVIDHYAKKILNCGPETLTYNFWWSHLKGPSHDPIWNSQVKTNWLFRNLFMFCFHQNFEIFYKIQLWHTNVYDKLDEQKSHIGRYIWYSRKLSPEIVWIRERYFCALVLFRSKLILEI